MRSAFFRPTTFLFCSTLFLSNPLKSNSQEQSEPQLLRVVNAQGEVKFSPGKNGKPDLGNDWMTAPAGLTVEEGYSIATENGRAVLEFENALWRTWPNIRCCSSKSCKSKSRSTRRS